MEGGGPVFELYERDGDKRRKIATGPSLEEIEETISEKTGNTLRLPGDEK